MPTLTPVPDSELANAVRALAMDAVEAAQRSHGATGFLTWVIAQNRGARTFFEKIGAELPVEQPFEWDGVDLVEAGYGWRDPDALLAACAAVKSATQ